MLWVLNETVLLSTQNTFSLMDKKKVTFLRTKVCLSGAIMLPWGGGGGGTQSSALFYISETKENDSGKCLKL